MSALKPSLIGTTSYIYPVEEDNLVENCRRLAADFPFIQLLYFGRDYLDELTAPRQIDILEGLRRETGVEYIVHLPSDLGLYHKRIHPKSRTALRRIEDLLPRLSPKYAVLHLDPYEGFETPPFQPANGEEFRERLEQFRQEYQSLAAITLIENTGYSLLPFRRSIADSGFGVCLDMGHVARFENASLIPDYAAGFQENIRLIHMHGFDGAKDHISLGKTPPGLFRSMTETAAGLNVPVILEVFSENDLRGSLEALEKETKAQGTQLTRQNQ